MYRFHALSVTQSFSRRVHTRSRTARLRKVRTYDGGSGRGNLQDTGQDR